MAADKSATHRSTDDTTVFVVPRKVGLWFRPGCRVSANKNVLTRRCLWCLAVPVEEGLLCARGPLLFDASNRGACSTSASSTPTRPALLKTGAVVPAWVSCLCRVQKH